MSQDVQAIRMTRRKPQGQLLDTAKMRELFREANPNYGSDFTDEEWEAIRERLEALTRLIYRMYERRQRQKRLSE